MALSVGTPHGVASRVYPSNAELESRNADCFRVPRSEFRVERLRGIAPYGVRTFLPRLAPEAILRLSKTVVMISKNPEGAMKESSKH